MENRQISDVVFYNYNGEIGNNQQACIFYTDGTIENVSYEEGITAAMEIAKEENIRTKEDFVKMINNNRIHVLSGKDLERRFQEFINAAATNSYAQSLGEERDEEEYTDIPGFMKHRKVPKSTSSETSDTTEELLGGPIVASGKEKKKKKNIFKRGWEKIKKSKLVRRMVLFVTALTLLGGAWAHNRKSKEGEILNNNIATTAMNLDNGLDVVAADFTDPMYASYSFNELLAETPNKEQEVRMSKIGTELTNFNGTFAEAHLEKGKDIKAALTWDEMVALDLAYNDYSKEQLKIMFNGTELDPMKLSNDYKNATLQLMGAHVIETRANPVNSKALINSQEGKTFVDKYHEMFLQCKEATGKEQIEKVNAFYKELYKDFPISNEIREVGISHSDPRNELASYKLAVTPMVAASEMMFQNLDIDKTLSDKAIAYFNDIGLCNIADAKFERVATITTTAETDKTIPLYKDFREAKIRELKEENRYVVDDEHRDLSQLSEYKKWVNKHVEEVRGSYQGTSSTRTYTTTSTRTETDTTYRTETTTEQTSDRDEAVRKTSEEEVRKAEDAVDQEIAKENEQAKEEGEAAAEDKREELQDEANKETDKIKEEIKKDEEDLQNKIDDANDQIDENNKDQDNSNDKPVNEEDFGDHEVDFDENHSDKDGNLDNSVDNITTNPDNDQTGEPLPDPNETGAVFDNEAKTTTPSNQPVSDTTPVETPNNNVKTESSENGSAGTNESGQEIYEYEEQVTTVTKTNEQIADEMVENMANVQTSEEAIQYVYTK